MANRINKTENKKTGNSSPREKNISRKPSSGAEVFRRFFVGIFGGGFLKIINFRKNIFFILAIILVLVLISYNNLFLQSKQSELKKLREDNIKINADYITTVQRTILMDSSEEKKSFEKYLNKGFVRDNSLGYDIKLDKNNEK